MYAYELNIQDKSCLAKNTLEEFILQKVVSGKFRKWKVNENHKQEIYQAISHNINNEQPIKFNFWFGGYKLYSLFPFAEVDWADFFAISYYCQYVSPILLVYPPGVDFTFMLDSKILTKINNISLDEINMYQNSFKKLLKEFAVFLPKNLKLNVQKSSDLYNDSEFE